MHEDFLSKGQKLVSKTLVIGGGELSNASQVTTNDQEVMA